MEPNYNQPVIPAAQPQENLPQPQGAAELPYTANPEQPAAAAEQAASQGQPAPIVNQPQQPAPAASSAQMAQIQAATSVPDIADDTDLIEKEWVIKAKQIVEQTKADPYLQSRELNKIKAEYIKKRYNKDVKVPES